MAKKELDYNPIADREEARRKGRGNPNRNNHTKRKNSNYGGYDAPVKKKVAAVTGEGRAKSKRRELPTWGKALLLADFAAVLVLLVLRLAVLPDSVVLNHLPTVVLGISCLAVFATRRYQYQFAEKKGGYTFLQVLLAAIGALYIVMGAAGILMDMGLITA